MRVRYKGDIIVGSTTSLFACRFCIVLANCPVNGPHPIYSRIWGRNIFATLLFSVIATFIFIRFVPGNVPVNPGKIIKNVLLFCSGKFGISHLLESYYIISLISLFKTRYFVISLLTNPRHKILLDLKNVVRFAGVQYFKNIVKDLFAEQVVELSYNLEDRKSTSKADYTFFHMSINYIFVRQS